MCGENLSIRSAGRQWFESTATDSRPLSLLPRAGNKKPGQVHCSTELLSLHHIKEVMFNEGKIKKPYQFWLNEGETSNQSSRRLKSL